MIGDGSIRRDTIEGDGRRKSKEAAERKRRRDRRRWRGRGGILIHSGRQRNQEGRVRWRRPWEGPAGRGSASEGHRRRNYNKRLSARHRFEPGQ